MSGIFGGSNKNAGNAGGGYWLTGGGTNAPFEMGPTPFDLSSIASSVSNDQDAITNRYNQLGMGGSTPESMDLTGASEIGAALTGQEQTQDVTNPALNPALQPPINELAGIMSGTGQNTASSELGALGTLLGSGGKALGGGTSTAAT
jgi:hypothetical protein